VTFTPWFCKIWGHDWSAVFSRPLPGLVATGVNTRGFAPMTHYQVCRRCKLERNPIEAVEIT
jgi:hypothetical protein